MGFEGANVIFDTWVHPLMMGLEEHLLQLFRDDFEFGDGAAPSHLHGSAPAAHTAPLPARPAGLEVAAADGSAPPVVAAPVAVAPAPVVPVDVAPVAVAPVAAAPGVVVDLAWLPDAEAELRKIPFFVRGKARRNTEAYARDRGIARISVDTLYGAKAHYGR
jgi:light-independent protochlorophyllide reductase subunit B